MKKKRLDELEENISEIDEKYIPLMELFFEWKEAVENGDKRTASKKRYKAEKWLRNKDGSFTKLAFFPPNDAHVAGICEFQDWLKFARFNWNRDWYFENWLQKHAISKRLTQIFRREGITEMEQIMEMIEDGSLANMKGIGLKSLTTIKKALNHEEKSGSQVYRTGPG